MRKLSFELSILSGVRMVCLTKEDKSIIIFPSYKKIIQNTKYFIDFFKNQKKEKWESNIIVLLVFAFDPILNVTYAENAHAPLTQIYIEY